MEEHLFVPGPRGGTGESQVISDAQYLRIVRLLGEGHTQRAVARVTRVSRTTIGRIATGRRPRKPPPFAPTPCARHRCGECGATIDRQPCVACHARRAAAEAGVSHVSEAVEEAMRAVERPGSSAEGRE